MVVKLIECKKCPVCAAPIAGRLPIIKIDQSAVFQCGCGVKYLEPSLDETMQIAIYENSKSLTEVNPVLAGYYEYDILDPLSRTARDYTRALVGLENQVAGRDLCEIGCGTGGFLAVAKSRKWNVLGIDSIRENIARARARGVDALPINIFEFSAPAKFDAVVLWDVLEHLQDPGRLLDKCRELLKPDGRLLIASTYDPNIISLLGRFLYTLSLGKFRKPVAMWYIIEHTIYFSMKGLRRLLGAHRFEPQDWWKSDTDLSRYQLGFFRRLLAECLLALARLLSLQTRLILIARAR